MLTHDKVKAVANVSDVELYHPGDHIDVSNGGILFRGGLSQINEESEKLTEKAQLDETSKQIKISINKSQQAPNKGHLSAQNASSVNQKEKQIADLEAAAKNMGLIQDADEGDLNGYQYIRPSKESISMVARSADYVVFMHFPVKLGEGLLRSNDPRLTPQLLDQVLQQKKFDEFKKANILKQINHLPGGFDNLKPGMTFQVRKSVAGNMFDLDVIQPIHHDFTGRKS